MNEHLKGPWKIVERETLEDGSIYPRHVATEAGDYLICLLESMNMAALGHDRTPAEQKRDFLIAAAPDLLACQTMGAQLNTPDFLDWIADRLEHIHGENPNVDSGRAEPEKSEPVTGLALAAIGVKHFGNPIPQAWYSAARELLDMPSAAPSQPVGSALTKQQQCDLATASFCVASVGDPTCHLHADNAERIIELLDSLRLAALTPEPAALPAEVTGLALAAIGCKHFGNPIPKAWYSAARELLDMPDATPIAAQPAAAEPPQWIDDPHDIEHGMMINPEWRILKGLTANEAALTYAPPTRPKPAAQAAAVPEAQPAAAEPANKWKEGYERLSAIINSLPESFDPVLDEATNKAINEARALAAPAQAAAVPEAGRERLRAEQASNVMPQIGPLLDAWEGVYNDIKATILEEAPDLARSLEVISRAMEGLAAPEAGAGGGK